MIAAVVPMVAFREKFGNMLPHEFTERVLKMALEFLHEHHASEKKLVKA